MYCQVIVDIVHENVAHTFTYAVPEGMNLQPGQRVAVPFGPREKEGCVISLSEETDFDPARVRPVLRPLENYPAILPPLMELAREMAETSHCPLAETLRLMMPAEMRGGRIKAKTVEMAELCVPKEQAVQVLEAEKRSRKRREILRMLTERSPRSTEEIGE